MKFSCSILQKELQMAEIEAFFPFGLDVELHFYFRPHINVLLFRTHYTVSTMWHNVKFEFGLFLTGIFSKKRIKSFLFRFYAIDFTCNVRQSIDKTKTISLQTKLKKMIKAVASSL